MLFGVVLLALPVCLHAALPKPAGYVNDDAGVLDAKTRSELVALLRGASGSW
jgi:uncharacterized membrane protein YgcG